MSAPTLPDILSYRRPAGSRSEEEFIQRFIVPTGARSDLYGNYILRIGDAPILWSAHTDTVHSTEGRQQLEATNGRIKLHPLDFAGRVFRKKGKRTKGKGYFKSWYSNTCLGADDGTGVWLLIHMIRQGVPGLYVFHREEECGAQGSSYIANSTPELVEGISYAVAFDRRGTDSVVTYQCGMRSASDRFAKSLADRLGLGMKPDNTGLFTDTQSYVDLIPECTNVSVGYYDAHTELESQDLHFACDLLDALVQLDLDLPVDRNPNDVEELWAPKKWGGKNWGEYKSRDKPKEYSTWELEICDFCGHHHFMDDLTHYDDDYLICLPCLQWINRVWPGEDKYAESR